jgi:hypothetical protein
MTIISRAVTTTAVLGLTALTLPLGASPAAADPLPAPGSLLQGLPPLPALPLPPLPQLPPLPPLPFPLPGLAPSPTPSPAPPAAPPVSKPAPRPVAKPTKAAAPHRATGVRAVAVTKPALPRTGTALPVGLGGLQAPTGTTTAAPARTNPVVAAAPARPRPALTPAVPAVAATDALPASKHVPAFVTGLAILSLLVAAGGQVVARRS